MDDRPPPYDAVVFDCDSTLVTIEGIDELAEGSGREAEIRELTRRAMDGEITVQEAYGARLEALAPRREDVERVAQRYLASALPHAAELIAALHEAGKAVHVVTGGLRPAVLPLAERLGVVPERVHAVGIYFDAAGRFEGFEQDSPLTRTGGKKDVIEAIRAQASRVCVVGDGVTDLEAAGAAERFVAFGGVTRREAVFARARVRCEDADLASLAPLLLTANELHGVARLLP